MNKFLITIVSIFCISSLAHGRGLNAMLIEAVKNHDMEDVIAFLNDSEEDKTIALTVARELGFSDNDILILASGLGRAETVINLLDLDKGINANEKGNFKYNPLNEAIFNVRPEIVRILLSHPGIIVDKSNLILAEEKFLDIKKLIEDAIAQNKINNAKKYEIEKDKIRQIGRMLINHLGLYTGQSRISKEGVIGVHGLPAELVTYIASLGNQ